MTQHSRERAGTRTKVRKMVTSVAASVKTWVEPLARLGYAAKGLVYVNIGILALRAALGAGGDGSVDQRESLLYILGGPFGQVLLALITLGLVGYALGHLLMTVRDPRKDEKRGLYALGNRGAHALSGFIHLSLALTAAELAFDFRAWRRGSGAPRDWTRLIMAYPLGRWLIAGVGLVVLGVAVYEVYKAYSASFRNVFREELMDRLAAAWVTRIGRLGYAARGITYGLIGLFLFEAAWKYDPTRVGGLGDALALLAAYRHGPWLLAGVAVGVTAYGLYGVLLARYRDFNV